MHKRPGSERKASIIFLLPGERQTFLCPAGMEINQPQVKGDKRFITERLDARGNRHILPNSTQCMLKPEHSLAETPTHIPEPSKRACQAVHPQMLLMAEQFGVPAFREGEVAHSMYLFCRLQLSRIRKGFQGILPDRF